MARWPKRDNAKSARKRRSPKAIGTEPFPLSEMPINQLISWAHGLSAGDKIELIDSTGPVADRMACLVQLLAAFVDIDRDDIHQAAERLVLVQEWIKQEAARAAVDPIFAPVRLAS